MKLLSIAIFAPASAHGLHFLIDFFGVCNCWVAWTLESDGVRLVEVFFQIPFDALFPLLFLTERIEIGVLLPPSDPDLEGKATIS